MRNQEHSDLYKAYRSRVDEYNEIVERIIKYKFEMDYLWKYKKDYPADWRKMVDKLLTERQKSETIRASIRDIKEEIRIANANYPQTLKEN
jgi:DNA-directed RNA polymerase subunit F